MNNAPKVIRKSVAIFDPFDRTPVERKYENASIGHDVPPTNYEIRDCFRVNRYGK